MEPPLSKLSAMTEHPFPQPLAYDPIRPCAGLTNEHDFVILAVCKRQYGDNIVAYALCTTFRREKMAEDIGNLEMPHLPQHVINTREFVVVKCIKDWSSFGSIL
jgi:hypothetical protein